MPFTRKVLWIVNLEQHEDSFKQHLKDSGCDTVCIRTTTSRFPDAIKTYKDLGKTVWAWRWPGVDPDPAKAKGPHYFAPLEAKFVAEKLIPAGLDGYIVDPESDHAGDVNDWNQSKLAPLAKDFCAVIKKAAAGKKFLFGTTSGCAYPSPGGKPHIPWGEFFPPSDALYPQCYWRMSLFDKKQNKDVPTDINGGTPTNAIKRGMGAWKPASMGKPIIPMAGEIDLATDAEIKEYGQQMRALGLSEAHFYADIPEVGAAVLAAIKAL